MTSEQCWRHLAAVALGRVALVRHGRALVFPVDHVTGLEITHRQGDPEGHVVANMAPD